MYNRRNCLRNFFKIQTLVQIQYINLPKYISAGQLSILPYKMRSVFAVSVPILATAVSAANGVCDQAQYSLLSCLENDDAASQECSSRMPVYTSTETAKQAASGYQVTVTVTDQDVRTTYVTR